MPKLRWHDILYRFPIRKKQARLLTLGVRSGFSSAAVAPWAIRTDDVSLSIITTQGIPANFTVSLPVEDDIVVVRNQRIQARGIDYVVGGGGAVIWIPPMQGGDRIQLVTL